MKTFSHVYENDLRNKGHTDGGVEYVLPWKVCVSETKTPQVLLSTCTFKVL